MMEYVVVVAAAAVLAAVPAAGDFPVVITTWNFKDAADAAWAELSRDGASALDAVQAGCSWCEDNRCDGTVGYGGSPDENGETTLDAMVMDGETLNVGAVSALRRVKSAAAVARRVLENTHHSMLAGELATDFAVAMGFAEESLATEESTQRWQDWKDADCQPNFWTGVTPDPTSSCGPYSLPGDDDESDPFQSRKPAFGGPGAHDTIGMVAIDADGKLAAGTSTNGANHKIPGRVGDSPIPGSGAYADSEVGGAAATGDGDVMLRLLPAFTAVEAMRQGLSPSLAAQEAVDRIARRYPDFSGAVVALSVDGQYGAACHGLDNGFPFSVASAGDAEAAVVTVECQSQKDDPSPSAAGPSGLTTGLLLLPLLFSL